LYFSKLICQKMLRNGSLDFTIDGFSQNTEFIKFTLRAQALKPLKKKEKAEKQPRPL
jgi:hypothetical protein